MNARILGRAGVAAALVILGGCEPAVSLPGQEPDAVGTVTDVAPSSADALQFTLTGYNEGEYFYHAAITVVADTVLTDAAGQPVDLLDVTSGARVSVWVDMCAESYPVQCTAIAVRLDETPGA